MRGFRVFERSDWNALPRPSGSPSRNWRTSGQDSMSFAKPNALACTCRLARQTSTFATRAGWYRERVELGYALSSEEHAPAELVRNARSAEQAGFGFGLISDHIHPWVEAQGHSAFVWSVLGSIAQATSAFRIGTGVT